MKKSAPVRTFSIPGQASDRNVAAEKNVQIADDMIMNLSILTMAMLSSLGGKISPPGTSPVDVRTKNRRPAAD
jgi:hypothetical protein